MPGGRCRDREGRSGPRASIWRAWSSEVASQDVARIAETIYLESVTGSEGASPMSTPLRNDQKDLSRREEFVVSGAAMADVPWAVAGAAGVVVTGADLALHLLG